MPKHKTPPGAWVIRNRKFPLRLTADCPLTWGDIREEIDPFFTISTELSNWALRMLMVLDDVSLNDKGKLPAFDNNNSTILYHQARELFPTAHGRSVGLMIRAIVKKWLRKRFEINVMRKSDLRGFRYPQPFTITERYSVIKVDKTYLVSFSLNSGFKKALSYGSFTRYEFCFRLHTNWRDAEILDRIVNGEYKLCPPSLMQDRHGKLLFALTYKFVPTPPTERLQQDREFVVIAGEPPKMLVCTWPGCDDSWVIPGTDIQCVNKSIERRRNLMRRDMKWEMRIPTRRRRRREAAITRACQRRARTIDTRNHQISAGLVRKAAQVRCGRIKMRYEKPIDYAWTDLETKVTYKANALGIVFETA